MAYSAGIDLGTTFTAAAVVRDGGKPEIVSLGDRAPSIPSVVLVREDTTVLTGEAADRRGVLEPERVAREFKRRLGDPTPLLLGGSPHSAESLQAKLLRSAYDAIVEREGGVPDRLAVTYPANWGPYKRELLAQTLRIAGLDDAILVTEPEAAAVHYAANERVETGEVVAVYDLGGGTFDAAILRKTEDGFEILGSPEGLERLGGIDFDHSVVQHVNTALGGALDGLDPTDVTTRTDVARLRADCSAAKEALSHDTEVTIPVALGAVRTDVRLTRTELDEMVRPAIAETVDAMRRAIASAGVEPSDVSRILLVGGASRMPIVSRMVEGELGRPVALDAHPKHAIALGASFVSATQSLPVSEDPSNDIVCSSCGRSNLAGSKFCEMCGQPLGGEPPVPAHPILPPPAPPGKRGLAKRRFRLDGTRRAVAGAVVVTLVAVIAGYSMFLRPEAQAGSVLYQDPVSEGPSPFTKPAVSVQQIEGDALARPAGPFGGSGELTTCNKALLQRFLNDNPDRKRAWTTVLGVPFDAFDRYVDSLRKAILTVDTRVTNHGFKGGKAFSLQSILAEGTAVLVDRDGKIVTRCFCGNPLTAPISMGASTCSGCPRGYAPPAACSGAQCYTFKTSFSKTSSSGDDEQRHGSEPTLAEQSDDRRAPLGRGRATAAEPAPTPQTFTSVQSASDDEDDEDEEDDSNDDDVGFVSPSTPQPTPERTPLPTRPPPTPCGQKPKGDSAGPRAQDIEC